ncbi:MAG: hypothetical protein IBX62_07940 [Coriobacteriia bacterium]|nr:hypothetical protein [Coriobacteriia bacterium]
MDAGRATGTTEALLGEALDLNLGMEALAGEGVRSLAGANVLKRGIAGKMVRDATGLTLEGLYEEARAATALLRRLRDGEADLAQAHARLRGYASLLRRVARFTKSLEPQAREKMKDPAARERTLGIARTHLAEADRLVAILETLAAEE